MAEWRNGGMAEWRNGGMAGQEIATEEGVVIPGAARNLRHMATTIQEQTLIDPPLTVGGRSFRSRLLVGTGKYRNNAEMVRAIEASGAEVVTVAVRRVDLDRTLEEGLLYHLNPTRYFLLANTAGCYTPEEA